MRTQSHFPSWFGQSAERRDFSDVVVGLRAPIEPGAMRRTQPGRNGWRYVSPENSILVEAVSYQTAAVHHAAWSDLTTRLIEPNVFLDPNFVLPAVQHFALARRPAFLLVWDEGAGERGRMIGLCPILFPHRRFGGSFATAWLHEQASVGAPLIDRARSIETVDLLLDWLSREQAHVSGLMIPKLRRDGPMLALLQTRALMTGRQLRLFGEHERAILAGPPTGMETLDHAFTPKKLKELRRQRRRLADLGKLTFRSARTPIEVRDANERFLALEASGWKGRRGTALLSDPGLATFTRTMTRLLAREGKCRIDTLELNGEPVGMGIILQSGGYAYLWKIAYDESHAVNSPGVQLVIDITKAQLAEEGIVVTDSGAIPQHPMIDHVWRGRLVIVDALISSAMRRTMRFVLAETGEKARRGLREIAKTAFYRAIGRRRS